MKSIILRQGIDNHQNKNERFWRYKMKIFSALIFGIMLGYAWQYHHHNLAIASLKQEITDNRKEIERLQDILSVEIKYQRQAQRIIECESNGRHRNLWGRDGEYGISQFKHKTFGWLKVLAQKPHLHWKQEKHQVWLLKWALKNGYGHHWTCYEG
jgi:hypothetical protein